MRLEASNRIYIGIIRAKSILDIRDYMTYKENKKIYRFFLGFNSYKRFKLSKLYSKTI